MDESGVPFAIEVHPVSVCHGGNSDDLVSIPAMTGTVAVNILCLF